MTDNIASILEDNESKSIKEILLRIDRIILVYKKLIIILVSLNFIYLCLIVFNVISISVNIDEGIINFILDIFFHIIPFLTLLFGISYIFSWLARPSKW
jgi:hypothetical protein